MKRIFILISFTLLLSYSGFSQQTTAEPDSLKNTDNIIFYKVEEEADFPGGIAAWKKYLIKNLKVNIPVKKGAPAGFYTVVIKFIVTKDGTVMKPEADTNHGYGMEEEVIRIISKGPKWLPARQNNKPVNAYRRQAVTFVISEK